MRLGVVLDLRNPPARPRPWPDLYAAALEFVEEADRLGLDVAVGEHHLWNDGYMPQPLTFLSAAAKRTAHARLATSILILPLHHPAEVAEQAAVVDCLSGGRLELGLGTGYRTPEFELFGVDPRRRLSAFEEQVERIRALWSEGGATPRPVQDPIPLWAGLRGPRGAQLAGRLGMGMLYLPSAPWDAYLRGIAGAGDGATPRLAGPVYAMLVDDPEAAFAELGPLIVEHWHGYDVHAAEGTATGPPPALSADEYRRIGPFPGPVAGVGDRRTIGFGVFTPEQAAAAIEDVAEGRSPDWVYFPAALGSRFDELAFRHLELIATRLRPLLERRAVD